MEILLVDDERHILQVIGDFLEDCGYQVCTAGNGPEAERRSGTGRRSGAARRKLKGPARKPAGCPCSDS